METDMYKLNEAHRLGNQKRNAAVRSFFEQLGTWFVGLFGRTA